MFQLSGDVLLKKGGNSFLFGGQHAIREQAFICGFSKFLQREKDCDVDHFLVLLQICGFCSSLFSNFLLCMPTAVKIGKPERQFVAVMDPFGLFCKNQRIQILGGFLFVFFLFWGQCLLLHYFCFLFRTSYWIPTQWLIYSRLLKILVVWWQEWQVFNSPIWFWRTYLVLMGIFKDNVKLDLEFIFLGSARNKDGIYSVELILVLFV